MTDHTLLGAGRYLRLVAVDGWEFVERANCSGVVAVIAVTEEGKIVLTEQYRRAVERRVIDIPAGLAGDIPGEESELLTRAAQRELLEETGYRADELELVMQGPTSPGMTNEVVSIFRAGAVSRIHAGGGDASEDIVVHEVPLSRIADWLTAFSSETTLIDPKVYAALYFTGQSQ